MDVSNIQHKYQLTLVLKITLRFQDLQYDMQITADIFFVQQMATQQDGTSPSLNTPVNIGLPQDIRLNYPLVIKHQKVHLL